MVDSVATKKHGDFDELIFKRELNEVYLLLDFISGRHDAHIWNLDVDIPVKGDANKKQTAFDLYQLISTMRYPPPGSNDTEDKAYNATVLLYVKDKLNNIAAPARGMTIAYTYLYLAEELPPMVDPGTSRASNASIQGQTKATVARDAFPGLAKSARCLRWKRNCISVVGSVAFILAVYLLCWTVYGSVIIKRFEEDRQSALDLEKNIATQLVTDKAAGTGKEVSGSVARVCCWDKVGELSPAAQGLCGNWSYFQARYGKAIADAGEYAMDSRFLTFFLPTAKVQPKPLESSECQACGSCSAKTANNAEETADASAASAASVAAATSASAVHATSAGSAESAGDSASMTSTASEAASALSAQTARHITADDFRQEDVQSVGLIVSVYSTYVLPLCFGFVGTVASFLRDTGNKALLNILAPRDESLAGVRLLLGAIAGIAVGLFYSPTQSAQQVTSGFGVLTLSASAIAFVAGYAADVFFNFLDNLSVRLFNLSGSTGSTK